MHYQPCFLPTNEAAQLFHWCTGKHVQWRHECFSIYGRKVTAPRRLAWFGERGINYRYTGLDHISDGWPKPLQQLRDRIVQTSDQAFNFVLLNRYDGGAQYMGWHRDDEVGSHSQIASLSLGATRRFRYRTQSEKASKAIDLTDGSLLLFDGRAQHMLTKTKMSVGTRINLTFRYVAH